MDEQQQKELADLMKERADLMRQLVQANGTLEAQRQIKRKTELTLDEFKQMPNDVVTYKAIGRMFLKEDIDSIKTELNTTMTSSTTEFAQAEKKAAFLQGQVDKVENSIKEIVAALAKKQKQ